MPSAPRPSRWSIDLEAQASLVEVLGGGALLVSALLLAGLGIVRVFHRHPSDGWFFGALALAGAGLLVLVVSFTAGAVAHRPRPPQWTGSFDASTPGVVLCLLEPAPAAPDGGTAAARLGPVRCQVALAGGGALTAPDDRISRVRGILMTRYHPAFFAGADDPASGTYHFQWDEQRDEEWHPLVTGSVDVVVRLPSPDDPDWGRELAARVSSPDDATPAAAPAEPPPAGAGEPEVPPAPGAEAPDVAEG